MLLKPLVINEGSVQAQDPPPRTCENCGTIVERGDQAINVMMCIGSPGHPDLAPFQCPHTEHWACSPDCWEEVAHACIHEHMLPLLKYRQAQINLKGA